MANDADRLTRLLNYLELDPGNTALQADAFDCALAAGRTQEARDVVAMVRTRDGAYDERRWTVREAMLAVAARDHAGALSILEALKAREAQPTAEVDYHLALARYGLRELDACVALLEPHVVSADLGQPLDSAILHLWARAMHEAGEVEAAWSRVSEVLARAPHVGPRLAGTLALLAFDADDLESSLRLVRAAQAESASIPEVPVVLGGAALLEEDAKSAERLAREALAMGAGGRALSLLGLALMQQGQLPAARAELEAAVIQIPGHVGTWQALGWCCFAMDDTAKALDAFQSAMDLDRNFAENHGALAAVLAKLGRTDEARACIERARRLDPDCASALYAEALLSGDAGDERKLAALAKRVLGRRR